MRTPPAVRFVALSVCVAVLPLLSARAQVPAETPGPAPAPAAATAAPGSTAAAAAASSDRRTLNGHTFMPAADVPWAFTITSLTADTLLALGETTATATIGGQTFSGNMTYAGIGGFLGYEYAFLDHYSVRATLNNIIYSGIDGKSALTVGTAMQFGFSLGATASMQIGDSIRAGVLLDARSTPGVGITIAQGLRNIVDSCNSPTGCNVDVGQIFGVTRVTVVEPALAVNWAPWRPLGVTANASYQRYSSGGATDVDGNAVSLAAAADWDFHAHSSVPVGLALEFSWRTPINSPSIQHVTDMGGGLYYTGRKDLSAGLQLVSRRFAVTPNVDLSWKTYLASIGLRYFW